MWQFLKSVFVSFIIMTVFYNEYKINLLEEKVKELELIAFNK